MTHDPGSGHVLTVGGLFSGIGGLELGLERAGMRVRWHCEADPFCQAVLARRWPGVVCYDDVRELTGQPAYESVVGDGWEPSAPTGRGWQRPARVDVLCGGFPCQPVSHNGHNLGADDERWLWPEFARVIRELRPRYVLLENVAALLWRGLSDVLSDLAAVGLDAEWEGLPAGAFGATHRRDRLYLLAYADSIGRQAPDGLLAGLSEADARAAADHRAVPRRGTDGRVRPFPDADVFGVADGFPTELDAHRLRAVGNAVCPQVAEWIGGRVIAHERAAASDDGNLLHAAGFRAKEQHRDS